VLIRQNGPVFGSSNPYSQAGETQITVSARALVSNDHYNGVDEQLQRHTLDTYVTNHQRMLDVNVTHVFSERYSMSVSVPFINSSWGIPSPTSAGQAARADEVGRGLGDIAVGGRAWVLPTDRFKSGNFQVGLGVKMPTGNAGYRDVYVDSTGNNPKERFVDQSVQPGDGGWGMLMEVSGFKRVKTVTLFGSCAYLANPRDRNDTTAGNVNRSPLANPPTTADTSFNSVPDQFLARVGGAVPIGKTGMAASLTWRVEGMPRYDLIGESHGFRRPGVEMFIEPGFSYAKGGHVYAFQVPIGYYRNRFPNPYTGNRGDATFPDYIVLATYGYRFGGKLKPRTNLAPVPAPTPGETFRPFRLKTLDGTEKSLPDVSGTRATLVVFFYPTCRYCNLAGPDIQRMYNTYSAQGLSVVWINILPDEQGQVARWQADHGYTAPVLVGGELEQIQNDYGVEGTPTHYLLDGEGRILSKHSGFRAGDEKGLEEEIKRAVGAVGGTR